MLELIFALLFCGSSLPPCYSDDTSQVDCWWDAPNRGDGQGHSFYIDEQGTAHFTYSI